MASLSDSLKAKAAGAKGPALSGPRPLIQPDVTAPEGQSGGIAASKKVKNAGSSSIVVPKANPLSDFAGRMGANIQSDKTGGYF